MEPKSNKTIVLACYRKIIRDLDLALVDDYVHDNYIQHSPTVKDGKAGLLEMLQFLKTLPKPTEQGPSPILRTIADGNLVAVHLDLKFMGQRIAVLDVFSVKDGKLAEHWDVGQAFTEPEEIAVGMTNGTTAIDETADSDKSRKLITDFCNVVFVGKNYKAADKYFAENYLEHNPANSLLSKADRKVHIHKIIVEGDFAVMHCECLTDDTSFAQFHIFRVKRDKIAEHWSVEQIVPEVMAHSNGMF
jgi:predicted SnoaL-like aldol condensation-catalyzing enzyme